MECFKKTPVGELRDIIQKFIHYKKSLGYKYNLEESLLYRFSLFSLPYTISDKSIPKNLVDDWISKKVGESSRTHTLRISNMKVFLQFARDHGYDVTLPQKPRKRSSNYVPYIFNKGEIIRFFNACDYIPPYPGTQKHIILPFPI